MGGWVWKGEVDWKEPGRYLHLLYFPYCHFISIYLYPQNPFYNCKLRNGEEKRVKRGNGKEEEMGERGNGVVEGEAKREMGERARERGGEGLVEKVAKGKVGKEGKRGGEGEGEVEISVKSEALEGRG